MRTYLDPFNEDHDLLVSNLEEGYIRPQNYNQF